MSKYLLLTSKLLERAESLSSSSSLSHSLSLTNREVPLPTLSHSKKNKEKEKIYFYEGYEMQGFGVHDKIKTSKSMLFTNILCKFAVDYEYLHKIQDNKGA